MNAITEYDGYKIEMPYKGKRMTEEEKKEYMRKKEEARKESLEILASLRED